MTNNNISFDTFDKFITETMILFHVKNKDELLNPYYVDGKIDMEAAVEGIKMKRKTYYLSQFNGKLPDAPSSDGRWHINIPLAKHKRKSIAANTRDELIDKVARHYEELDTKPQNLTDIFVIYRASIMKLNPTLATIHKDVDWAWNKYIKDDPLSKIPFDIISDPKIYADAITKFICNNKLTKRHWYACAGLLNALFEQAYISCNINIDTSKVHHRVSSFCVDDWEGESSRINYLTNEAQVQFKDSALKLFLKTMDIKYLAIIISLLIGTRAGELVAIKDTDIDWDKSIITIARQEVKHTFIGDDNKIHTQGYEILPYVKSKRGNHIMQRNVILSDDAMTYLKRAIDLKKQLGLASDYLFVHQDKNGNIVNYHVNDINKAIYEAYYGHKRNGATQQKSISNHTLRKTYNSNLSASGDITLSERSEQLGHDEYVNAKMYSFPTAELSEKQVRITRATDINKSKYQEDFLTKGYCNQM